MKLSVRAADLPGLLDQAPAGIKCLSLDCFDTLLWRHVHQPTDVFADLGLAGGPDQRIWAEKDVRRTAPYRRGGDEVTIDEIYAQLMPGDADGQAAAIARELEAEARQCYGFAPTRDLMRAAKARGLRVIIVSDTYLHQPQLRDLIAAAAGDEVIGLIDEIFVSSAFGVAKAGGLFTHVLAATGLSPAQILHVGDNPVADQQAPSQLGINTAHLRQFDAESIQRLRLESAAASIADPAIGLSRATAQPHRAQIARREQDDAAYVIGHDVLGPLLHGFAHWVRDETQAMEAKAGKPVKIAFLLRDGHLPSEIFRHCFPDLADRILTIELSRFTARAASFASEADIADFVLPRLSGREWKTICRQLGLMRDEAEKLSRNATPQSFGDAVMKPAITQRIITRSARAADRLAAYLRAQGIADGDAVMLVDLGYNGSVQNAAEPVLRRVMGLDVAGRYLLLREMAVTGLDKAGWFDVRHCDPRLLHALSESIAIVEQLCTVAQGSVTGYRDDGTPVRDTIDLKGEQNAARDRAQAAAIDFVQAADAAIVRPAAADTPASRRDMGLALLTRLLFLPTDSEVALFAHFDHDANLGTGANFKLVDLDSATTGLRRRGVFYTKNAMRMYLPGELQRHGLPINLSMLTSRRFGLDLRKADFDVGQITLSAIIADATRQAVIDVTATPTHDGFYAVQVPIGAGQYTVCLPVGDRFDIVQIEHASFVDARQLMGKAEAEHRIDANVIVDGMTEIAPGLWRATGEQGIIAVPPPGLAPKGAPLVLDLVFRPIATPKPAAVPARKVA